MEVNGVTLIEDLGTSFPRPTSKQIKRFGLFKCPYCGTVFRAMFESIKRGHTKSCGCHRRSLFVKMYTTHGLTGTKLHNVWFSIKNRCYNPNCKSYKDYGAKGVVLCNEWLHDFKAFYDWANDNGYLDGLEIDRINVYGNYSPENCRWVPRVVNAQNKRLNKNNKTGYRGVNKMDSGNFFAAITSNGVRIYIGSFKSADEAAMAYNDFIIKHHTNHPLNVIN